MKVKLLKKIRRRYNIYWSKSNNHWLAINLKTNKIKRHLNITDFLLKYLGNNCSLHEWIQYERKKVRRKCKEYLTLREQSDMEYYRNILNKIPDYYKSQLLKTNKP